MFKPPHSTDTKKAIAALYTAGIWIEFRLLVLEFQVIEPANVHVLGLVTN